MKPAADAKEHDMTSRPILYGATVASPTYVVCPKCGEDDIYVARRRPILGDILECGDCDHQFPDECDEPRSTT